MLALAGTILLWIVVIALMLVGVVGTVVPALPGAVFVFAGVVLGAWIDDFTRVGSGTIIFSVVLTVLAWVADYLSAVLGAKRLGASREAILGALIGTGAGIFTGLVGIIFLPLVGAAIGEFIAVRNVTRAGSVGIATWIGLLVGTAVKIALCFVMIGVFIFALFV